MATVSKYTSNRNLVRTADSRVNTIRPNQGSARFFGANEAQYKGQIADTVNKVGSALMQYGVKSQDRKDRIIVRNKLNSAREELRAYYANLYDSPGSDALDAYELGKQKIEEIRRRELSGMDNDSQVEYFAASFDDLSQAHMKRSWDVQESMGRKLDYQTKDDENKIFEKEMMLDPLNRERYIKGREKTIQNILSMHQGEKTIEQKKKISDEADKQAEDIYKEFGIPGSTSRGPSSVKDDEVGFYTDAQVKKALNNDKDLAEIDPSKLTKKQRALMQERDEESLSWIEKNIVRPIYDNIIQPVGEGISNIGQNISEEVDKRSLSTALDRGRRLPSSMTVASRKAAISASNLELQKINAVADQPGSNSYINALMEYKENKDLILPSQRGPLLKRLARGARVKRLEGYKTQYLGDTRPIEEQIDEVAGLPLDNSSKKLLIDSITDNAKLKNFVQKEQEKKQRDAFVQEARKKPFTTKVPLNVSEEQYLKMTSDKEKIEEEAKAEAGMIPPKHSNSVLVNELLGLSDSEKRKIDYDKYGKQITERDKASIRSSIGKGNEQYHNMATSRAKGIKALTAASFSKNRVEEKRIADQRLANYMTAFRINLENMQPADKTPEKIDKMIDHMLTPKIVPPEGTIKRLFTSDLMYQFEFNFIKDMERKEELSDKFIPDRIKEKYKDADKIWMNTTTGNVHVENGAKLLIIDLRNNKEYPFRKSR